MAEHRLFPYFLILGAGIVWGATFSLALIATAQGAHPLVRVKCVINRVREAGSR
jgi:hypothetical protein